MNVWGRTSKKILKQLTDDLVKILNLGLRRSAVDFGLNSTGGARTVAIQQHYFDTGKSKINPKSYSSDLALAKKAKHIVLDGSLHSYYYTKSRAVDIHIAEKHRGKSLTWDRVHLAYVAAILSSCAQELFDLGKIDHLVRWGGDWDGDGVISKDQSFDDFPHTELVKQ